MATAARPVITSSGTEVKQLILLINEDLGKLYAENEGFRKLRAEKDALLAQAITKRDWPLALVLVGSGKERWRLFAKLAPEMTDAEYWVSFKDVWISSEAVGPCARLTRRLLKARLGAAAMMSKGERKVFDRLPDPVMAWRGVSQGATDARLSWTLSKTKARWFATRGAKWDSGYFDFRKYRPGIVIEAAIPKREIAAYISGDERELIVPNGQTLPVRLVAKLAPPDDGAE